MTDKKEELSVEDPEVSTKKSNSKKWIVYLAFGILIVALIAAVIAILALAIERGVNKQETTGTTPNVCLTDGCVQAGAHVQSHLNESVDPCVNFYQFACGNWLENNVIPSGEGSYGTINEIIDQNEVFLRQALEGGDDEGVEAVRKAFDFYASCLDTTTINSLGARPLLDLISNTGGWSLIGIPDDEQWSLNGTQLIREHILNSDSFFSASIDIDARNSSAYILLVGHSSRISQRLVTSNPQAYQQFYVTLFTLLNSTIDQAVYVEAAEQLVEFESRLEEISLSGVDLRNLDVIYNRLVLSDLYSLWEDFDWLQYFQAILNVGGVTVNIEENEPVIVTTLAYFQNLTTLVRETNTSVLQNYARTRFVTSFLSNLGEEFVQAVQDLDEVVTGTRGEQDRTKICISNVQQLFSFALARPYVRNSVPSGTKETVSMMIDYINKAFLERLDELNWLDETTRQRSKEKVIAITRMIAYPDRIFEDNYLNEIYADYVIDPTDFFGNSLGAITPQHVQRLRVFRQGYDKTQWPSFLPPTAVNAAYSPQVNQYFFLAGILLPPAFSADWPDYLNFGAFGSIIGHELTHGFDDQGQRFDKDGILRQWWTDASIAEFRSRHQCFIDQYSSYTNAGAQVDGQLTLGENIADNGGVNTAFQAHRKRQENGGLGGLPSLDKYTPDQLFFVAWGQFWCRRYVPAFAQFLTFADVHSPGEARTNGPLINSPDFAEAFSCPVGSPMNPPTEEKCLLW